MAVPIFLSFPKPHLRVQIQFAEELTEYLRGRGLEPRTLGVGNYDMDVPLAGIRRLMKEACGFIGLALRRSFAPQIMIKHKADVDKASSSSQHDQWLTSPFVQIETAMAFQLGLPILIARERGVYADGVLERGLIGLYLPEIDLEVSGPFATPEWSSILNQWEGRVRGERRGYSDR